MFAALLPGFSISYQLEGGYSAVDSPDPSLFPDDFGDEYDSVSDPGVVVQSPWDYVVKAWLPKPALPGSEPDYAEMAKGPYWEFKEMYGSDAQEGFRENNGDAPDGCPARFAHFFT